MKNNTQSIDDILHSLPEDRKHAIETVLKSVRNAMPKGYEEAVNWGMICWQVPLEVYPDTYNKQPLMYAALASQKNYMALYIMSPSLEEGLLEQFQKEYLATGKKLDMGKSCVRFKKLEDLPLEVISKYIALIPMDEYISKAKQKS